MTGPRPVASASHLIYPQGHEQNGGSQVADIPQIDPEQQLVSGGGNVKESWKRAEIAYETPFPPSPRPPTPLTEQLALAGKGGGKRWDETELLINIMTWHMELLY